MATSGPDEIFDIVDAADQVVGQASRGEVHARNLRHRAIHILIYNEQGEFFLQKRSLTKDRFPGCWDSSCSGHVDTGETYAVAAVRELEEELGWRLQSSDGPLRPLLKLPATEATGFEFIQVYLLGPAQGPFQLNPEEISEGDFVSPAHLDDYLRQYPQFLAGAFRFLWANHRAELIQGSRGSAAVQTGQTTASAGASDQKKWWVGLGALGVLLSKLKFLGLFLLKFGKSAISILFYLWFYYTLYGWKFAICFVALIFIHEMGHLLAAKWCGVPASAPIFIPFVGAMIQLKQHPQNAWIEAIIGYGGPFIGGLGCYACLALGVGLGQDWLVAGATVGFFLNLFNLIPVPPLDGGRICAGISPWFWVVGIFVLGAFLWYLGSIVGLIVIGLIVLLGGLSRIRALFRKQTDQEQLYYGIAPVKRVTMAILYLALLGGLFFGSYLSHQLLPEPPAAAEHRTSGDDDGNNF